MPHTSFHTIQGSGEGTPLVFVNSLGTDLRSWDALLQLMAKDPTFSKRRLVRYDKRGHGRSACPSPPYTMEQLSDDLSRLIEELNFDRVALTGISVGGMIAMQYAATNPGKVKALILCDTAPVIGTPAGWNQRIDTLRRYGMAHLGDAILARWFAAEFSRRRPDAYRYYYDMLVETSVDGYTGVCEAIRDADLSELPGRITAPTLVICGQDDAATPLERCRQLADTIPGARFEIIADAAHLPMIEQPARFFEIVTSWWAKEVAKR